MSENTIPQFVDHSRAWEQNRYIYPVVSRRSKGLSIGVNLNPDRICNFDCVYCQIDRRSDAETKFVGLDQLLAELRPMLEQVRSGAIWNTDRFQNTPGSLRRLNDIAFSGDGEPTSHRNFPDVVSAVAELKHELGLPDVKLVLITNASLFHRPAVREGLEVFDANNGEIWAKLDAGTDAYYRLIERTPIPFTRILDNITDAARRRDLVIQSMFLRMDDVGPSAEEITAFCHRLNNIVNAGGRISLVQLYTVARATAEANVTALYHDELDAIRQQVDRQTGLPVEVYYGNAPE